MKIILVILHLVISLSSIVIYHLYWTPGSEYISRCHMIYSNKSRNILNQNLESWTNIKNSSVWCWGSSFNDRICYFHNLYFYSNEYIFVNGKDSLYYGLPENQFDPALLDLSSVQDHNGQFFNYVDVLYENSGKLLGSAKQVSDLTLAFHRFHPDNLMHVLHDDLIPLFHTLETFSPIFQIKIEDVKLFFADNRSPGKYKHLYEIMSVKKPLFKSALHNETICFSQILVGLVKNATWYQYGFLRPQGPLPHKSDAHVLRKFAQFLRRKFNLEGNLQVMTNLAILLVRKENRLILNEVELAYGLVHDLGLKVLVMSQESHSLSDIIAKVSMARVLIAMHGSLLILSVFLQTGAQVVELFPYAVNPDNYTPYKTLAGIAGLNYAAWRNADIDKTLIHPDRPSHKGGIRHLPSEQQEEIMSSSEVPLHLCCDDPHWLFRIYQDTKVDVGKVIELVAKDILSPSFKSFSDIRNLKMELTKSKQILPSRITSIKCSTDNINGEPVIFLSWSDPINIDSVNQRKFVYEVWLHESGTDHYLTFHLTSNSCRLSIVDGIKPTTSYHIWIRGVANGTTYGPFNNFGVTCMTQ